MGKFKVNIIEIAECPIRFRTDSLKKLLIKAIKNYQPELLSRKLELCLVWVTDQSIKQLNRSYRKKNQPTDVLSFSYLPMDNDDDTSMGEIVISADTLRKQALRNKHTQAREAQILFVHGVLHILGHDHKNKRDFEIMKNAERFLLGDNSGLISNIGLE